MPPPTPVAVLLATELVSIAKLVPETIRIPPPPVIAELLDTMLFVRVRLAPAVDRLIAPPPTELDVFAVITEDAMDRFSLSSRIAPPAPATLPPVSVMPEILTLNVPGPLTLKMRLSLLAFTV